ncbi:MAG: hypothetical protein AB1450_07710 [Pseudomonadota bacterium]
MPRLSFFLIYLRCFWPAVPAAAFTLGLGWLLWGLSPWVSVMVPVGGGLMLFAMLALVDSAAH